MRRALLAIGSVALLLAGCKADLKADVALSELNGAPAYLNSILSVEVSSCTEYGTDFESSSLLELKARVPVVFPKSTYLGCKSSGFETRATFAVPIRLGPINGECSDHDICLGPSSEDPTLYLMSAGSEFRSNYKKLGNSEFSEIEPLITIGFTNDSDGDLHLTAFGLYVNGKPVPFAVMQVRRARYAELKLSNVAVDGILEGQIVPLFVLE